MSTTEIKRPPYFRDLQAAHRYLVVRGYSTSERSLRRHREQGKLPMTARGVISRKQLDAYAVTYLRRADLGTTPEAARIAEEKAQADSLYLEESAKLTQLRRDRDAGRLIPRTDAVQEYTRRALVLKASLQNETLYRAGDILQAIDADTRWTPDLLEAVEDAFLDALDRVSRIKGEIEIRRRKDGTMEARWNE